MDKKKALEEAKQAYKRNLANIEMAQKICNEIDSVLPKNWQSKFWGAGYLEFCPVYPHKPSSAEFRMVCDLVEKATGEELHRRGSGSKENVKLYASNYLCLESGVGLTLWVESEAESSKACSLKWLYI